MLSKRPSKLKEVDENNEDESNEGYNDEDQNEANELKNSLKKSTEEIAEKWGTPFLKRKLIRKMEKNKPES